MESWKWPRPKVPWSKKRKPGDQPFTKKWPWTRAEKRKRKRIAKASRKKNKRR